MLLLNMGFSGIVLQICENVHDLFGVECNYIFLFCPRTSLCVCVAIIVHQESVCATFGSGLSSACVVDVGDQKTSLCCVEDGVSHRNSRFDLQLQVIFSYRFICRLWSKFTFLIHNCDPLCMVAADCWCVNRDGSNVFITVSRVCLAYGGSDVTRTFFWLLQRAGFPYRECQLNNRLDCQLLQHLKETLCHLEQVCIDQGGRVWLKV